MKLVLNMDQITDNYGQSLPNGTAIVIDAPRQITTEQEAEAIEQSAQASETTSLSVMGGNFLLNFLMAGALMHLWSLLGGL